jgi:methionine-rich copper-binding protein CopC
MKALSAFLFTFLFASHAAFAHTFPDRGDPPINSHVATSPTEVKLWFIQDFDPSGTSMQIFDSSNLEVDLKDSHQDKTDTTLLIVSVPALTPGTYKVRWQALCMYGHHTQGSYEFTID